MTAFTKAQKAEFVHQLEACKPFLWDGTSSWGLKQTRYICTAVAYGADDLKLKLKYPVTLPREIERRLGKDCSLGDWLRNQGIPSASMTDARVQAHRHAWVDLLIEEFSQ